jgi:tetratricopeptide (TPR) repeat protein
MALRNECFDVAESLVRTLPGNPHSLCLLGTVHNMFASEAEALRLWERCLEIEPQFADAHLMLGHRAVSHSDFAAAEQHFRHALRIDPTWDEVPLPLADALLQQDKPREAVRVLESFVTRQPHSFEGWCRLGKAYDQLQHYDLATKSYAKALELDDESPDAHYGVGTALQKLGEEAQAREHLDRFRQLQSALEQLVRDQRADLTDESRLKLRTATTYLTAARVYALHAQLEEAEAHWQRSAELNPQNRESRESLADLYSRQGRAEQALALRRELCDLEPGNPARWLTYGKLAYQHRRLDEAAGAFRYLIEQAPQQPDGYALLAQVEASRNLPEALRLARTAVEMAPTAPHHFILADVLWRAGDEGGCRRALERALELDPHEPRYREAYARLKPMP